MSPHLYFRVAFALTLTSLVSLSLAFILVNRGVSADNQDENISTPSNTGEIRIDEQMSEEEVIPVFDTTTGMRVFASIPYWDQPRAIQVFKDNVELFDIVSVFWYQLTEEGMITKYRYAKEDSSFIEFAHQHDVKVLALVANLPEDDTWDPMRVDEVISDEGRRGQHIEDIVALVEEKDFDGVNIDYEFLRNRQESDFSTFIKDLANALHEKDKILAVAIHAQLPEGPTRGQDMVALQTADILSFMTYDEHWDTSDPGPPASAQWVRDVLEYAVSLGVNPRKIFMGIPLYGYDWPRESDDWGQAKGIEYDEVVRIANSYDVDITFDPLAKTSYFQYEKDGTEHYVWFDSVSSVEEKLKIAEEFGVGGVFFWRQGREDARIYDLLKE